MALADASGLPLAVSIASASPHEVTLVESVLAGRFVAGLPQTLIGDRAYDSRPLKRRLAESGITLIAPHNGRGKDIAMPLPLHDRTRNLRRWRMERLFAWLQRFRRLVVRYEYHAENFHGFLLLACIVILLRHL